MHVRLRTIRLFLSHSGREILLSFIKIYFASGKCVEETRFKRSETGP